MRPQTLGGRVCVSGGVCVRLGWRRGSPVIPVESGWGASYVVMNDSVAMLCVCRGGRAVEVENREWGHLVELRGAPVCLIGFVKGSI